MFVEQSNNEELNASLQCFVKLSLLTNKNQTNEKLQDRAIQ